MLTFMLSLLDPDVTPLIESPPFKWLKVLAEGLLDTVLDLNQALELSNRVVLFFDRAIYYTTVGYEKVE